MKYLFLILAFCVSAGAYGQSTSCEPNMDFEYGNFSRWSFFQGSCCIPFTVTTVVLPPSVATSGRETITSGTGTDPYGGFPVVAPGGSYSLKLGMDDSSRKADRARYFVHVPSGTTNYALIYRYAIVMEDPGHVASKQPRFQVNTQDSATGISVPCGNFLYVAGSLPGFNLSTVGTSVYYKAWSTATINLTGYNGHTVIVDFTRGDCDLGAHFGYGYVDMTCGLFAITISPCHYGTTTTLSGPPGFQTYMWWDSTYSTIVDSGQTATITTPSTSKTYHVVLTPYSGYGCTDTLTTRVIISNLALHPHDTAICIGSTISLNAGVTGGNPPLSYNWTPITGLSCTNCLSPSITPTTTKKYFITVADSNGCSRSDSIRVKVNPLPSINAGADKVICNGNAASVTATGGYTYVWSPATGLSCSLCASPTATPGTTTTYVVTGTDTNGCVNRDTMLVHVNPLPNVNAGADKVICYNNSTTLTATGASTYTWSPTTGLSCSSCASPTASPNNTTTYIVTGTDSNSCVKTDTVIVHVNPLPLVNAGADKTTCNGNNTLLTATGASTYTWSPTTGLSCSSCASPTASPNNTTTYIVTGTDSNSCVKTDTVIVHVNPLPNVNAGADKTICNGSNTTLTATGAATYSWTPVTGLSCSSCASPTASPTSTTTYIVTGTDSNSCVKTDTVLVHVNPLPNVNAGPDKVICNGSTTTLTATGAFTYVWSPATGLSCTTCVSPIVSATSTTTYVLTGTDTNGCIKTDTVLVYVNPLPNVNAGIDKTICFGGSTSLTATGAATYTWSPATGLSCSSCTSPIASPGTTTTYILTGTDTNNCIKNDTVIVNVNPIPNVNAGPDKTICYNNTVTLTATGASTYIWSPATGLSCSSCASPVASPGSTTTYVVTGTDTNGCVKTDTVIVHVNPLPNVNAGADKIICNGNSATLMATGASTYVWSPTTGLSCSSCASPIASPTSTTNYVVTGTDSNSCTKSDTVQVHVNPLPNMTGTNKEICVGDTTTLSVSGASTYVWSPTTALSCSTCASTRAFATTTTNYTVIGTDSNNCAKADTIVLQVNPLPNVNAGPDQAICYSSITTITATGAYSYLWSPSSGLSCLSCATTLASPTGKTSYVVKGTDINGCVNTDTIVINVQSLPIVKAGPDTAICQGAWAMLTATGAVTYKWTPAASVSCGSCDTVMLKPTGTTKYTVTGTDSSGCRNTAAMMVTVHNLPVINIDGKTTICDSSSVQLLASGAKSYSWSPAYSLSCANCANPVADPDNDITYTVVGTDIYGCKDSNTIALTVIKKQPVVIGKGDTICQGQSTQLFASGGTDYFWTPAASLNNNLIANPMATPDTTTQYKVVIKQGDCFTDSGYIPVYVVPLPTVYLGGDTTILVGESVQLNATIKNALSYLWSPATGLSCVTCPTPIATPIKTTTYSVYVTGLAGCNVTADVKIAVKCEGSQVFIPNTFTPNGDGKNDKFYVSGKGITLITRFSVFDRWGELIYNINNIPVNEIQYGWDGTYKGKEAKPDVYVYIINATCASGELLHFKGDVSIVK